MAQTYKLLCCLLCIQPTVVCLQFCLYAVQTQMEIHALGRRDASNKTRMEKWVRSVQGSSRVIRGSVSRNESDQTQGCSFLVNLDVYCKFNIYKLYNCLSFHFRLWFVFLCCWPCTTVSASNLAPTILFRFNSFELCMHVTCCCLPVHACVSTSVC